MKSFKAADSEDLSFNNLHKDCGAKTGVQKVCRAHGADPKPITDSEIVKGYEVTKGQFVILNDDELKALPLPSKDTIAIREFVPAEAVDPVYIEASYYLEPDKGGAKAFSLLTHALANRNLAAIGTVTFRKRESLVMLRAGLDGTLLLHTLYTDDEVRVKGALKATETVSEKELQLADMLIDMQLKKEFIAVHDDHYEEALKQLVAAKMDGKLLSAPAVTVPVAGGLDLEAMLAASISAAQAA